MSLQGYVQQNGCIPRHRSEGEAGRNGNALWESSFGPNMKTMKPRAMPTAPRLDSALIRSLRPLHIPSVRSSSIQPPPSTITANANPLRSKIEDAINEEIIQIFSQTTPEESLKASVEELKPMDISLPSSSSRRNNLSKQPIFTQSKADQSLTTEIDSSSLMRLIEREIQDEPLDDWDCAASISSFDEQDQLISPLPVGRDVFDSTGFTELFEPEPLPMMTLSEMKNNDNDAALVSNESIPL